MISNDVLVDESKSWDWKSSEPKSVESQFGAGLRECASEGLSG